MNEGTAKKFDCVKWTREVRDKIYDETKDMTREERQQWYSRRPRDPVIARLFDRRKPPVRRKAGRSRRNAGRPPSMCSELDATDFDPSDDSHKNEERITRNEIVFEVTQAPKGGYDARSLGHAVFAQGEDWDNLKEMVRDAVRCHFGHDDVPGVVKLRFVRDEAIAV